VHGGTRDGHKDAVVDLDRMAKDVSEDAEMFHLGQGVLDDDADEGEQGVMKFLLWRERVCLTPLVGQGAASPRRVVLQPLEAAVVNEREIGRDLLQGAGLPQQGQIVGRPQDRGTDVAQAAALVDDDERLAHVRLLLARVVSLLCRVVVGSLHLLFGGVDDGHAVRAVQQRPGILRLAQRLPLLVPQEPQQRSRVARDRALIHGDEDAHCVAGQVQAQPRQRHEHLLSQGMARLGPAPGGAPAWSRCPLFLGRGLVARAQVRQRLLELVDGQSSHRFEGARFARQCIIGEHTHTLRRSSPYSATSLMKSAFAQHGQRGYAAQPGWGRVPTVRWAGVSAKSEEPPAVGRQQMYLEPIEGHGLNHNN